MEADAATPPESGRPHLEEKLQRMGKVYERFGRDGMKNYCLADVQLLLSSKELDLQAARGRHQSDQQAAATRMLTLEVADLSGDVRSQFAALQPARGVSMAQLRQHQPQQQKPRGKDRGYER